jgi:hypothetical protein
MLPTQRKRPTKLMQQPMQQTPPMRLQLQSQPLSPLQRLQQPRQRFPRRWRRSAQRSAAALGQ